MSTHFGEHLTIDGYGGDPAALDDKELISSSLVTLSDHLGMRRLDDVRIVAAPDTHNKDPGGWSAFVVIAESHLSIHTFPRRRFLSADVYTCLNGMNVRVIVEFFKDTFRLEEVEQHLVKRGTRYPLQNYR